MRPSNLLCSVPVVVATLLVAGCSAESKKAALLERANTYYKAMEYDKARIEYLNVLQKDPENTVAIERMALIWLEQGSSLRALPFLLKMRTVAPDNLDVRVKLAQLMLSVGKVAEARKEAVAVLERSSSFPDALVVLTEA